MDEIVKTTRIDDEEVEDGLQDNLKWVIAAASRKRISSITEFNNLLSQ